MSRTEERHDKAEGLDSLAPAEILSILCEGQLAAAQVVADAIPSMARAATLMANALKQGGRLVYAGAGSSGLMALADALELPGTYGIPEDRIRVLFAGGLSGLTSLPGGPEDDVSAGRAEAEALELGPNDCVIAVSASGSTPYVMAIAEHARERNASVVAFANNAGASLFGPADVAILLATPPEVIAGSTRMGAGTAQKIAFNMVSTLVGVMLGHVHDGRMVNLKADNEKLRARASRMVSEISGIGMDAAEACLAAASGSVKIAVLLAAGVKEVAQAEALLAAHGQHLRPALQSLRQETANEI
jgi:N-acetylmuramic acid 6-phosphate etherase